MTLVALAIAASVLWAIGIVIAGARRPGYSHVRNTVSELGEMGAPGARVISLALFVPVGLTCLAIAVAVAGQPSSSPDLASGVSVIAASIGIGYVGASLIPCDPGSPLRGSPRQTVHNLIGTVQYVGVACGLWLAGRSPSATLRDAGLISVFLAGACFVGLAYVMLSVPQTMRVRGLLQRITELASFAALIAGVDLLRGSASFLLRA